MLVGAAVGAIAGLLLHHFFAETQGLALFLDYVTVPVGQVFLRSLFMLVMPLVFAALVMGVCELDLSTLARIAVRTLTYTVAVSVIAVFIGLATVNAIQPGRLGKPDLGTVPAVAVDLGGPSDKSFISVLVEMIPDNPIKAAANGDILAWLLFSLVFGIGLSLTQTEGAKNLRQTIQGLYDVLMRLIAVVLKLGPIGVCALLMTAMARMGTDMLGRIGAYSGTVILALAIHMFVVYPAVLWFFARKNPIAFFRESKAAILTAFSTASSSATLPTALRVAEEDLKLPRDISRFVLTAGSTMNQNGSALFEGVTVLFLAQAYDVPLTLGQQLLVLVICVLAGIGTAGVPAGTIPVLAMMLRMLNIPPEGLGIILGVDRLLDMCRTTLNVTGDLVAAVYVASGEKQAAVITGDVARAGSAQ
ncbi:MAG: dicarboxylate/amino acid:cation symporter [Clostridia bacterium]|nr:dicarboxylate/amino acid:cation symporter [Deltaproteobacteria bacterium]